MERIYEVNSCDGIRCYDVHTKFHRDRTHEQIFYSFIINNMGKKAQQMMRNEQGDETLESTQPTKFPD
jgi:hypothetical protein